MRDHNTFVQPVGRTRSRIDATVWSRQGTGWNGFLALNRLGASFCSARNADGHPRLAELAYSNNSSVYFGASEGTPDNAIGRARPYPELQSQISTKLLAAITQRQELMLGSAR